MLSECVLGEFVMRQQVCAMNVVSCAARGQACNLFLLMAVMAFSEV